MAEPGGDSSAMRKCGSRIAEFGAALVEPVAATVPLHLRFRIGRKTLTELLVLMRPQTAVAIGSQYLKRESQGVVLGGRTCPAKPAFGRTIAEKVGEVGSSSPPTLWTVPIP
jgi:hypothetical protein